MSEIPKFISYFKGVDTSFVSYTYFRSVIYVFVPLPARTTILLLSQMAHRYTDRGEKVRLIALSYWQAVAAGL